MSVWLLIVTVVLVLTLILRLAMNAIKKKLRKKEEDEHPCGTCVRWCECNGVDDDCPWR